MREYKYLGVTFTISGKFSVAISYLYSRGQKAYFKLIKIFKHAPSKPSTVIHTFDHTVKPILLYASRVWSVFDQNKFARASGSPIEKVFK